MYEDPETAIFRLLCQSAELEHQRAELEHTSAELEHQSAELERLNSELARLKNGAPHAPSSSIPPYHKHMTQASRKGKSKRGAKPGHQGSSRQTPPKIDRREEHTLESCPDCGGALTPCGGATAKRKRVIEDIPRDIASEVTEHSERSEPSREVFQWKTSRLTPATGVPVAKATWSRKWLMRCRVVAWAIA